MKEIHVIKAGVNRAVDVGYWPLAVDILHMSDDGYTLRNSWALPTWESLSNQIDQDIKKFDLGSAIYSYIN